MDQRTERIVVETARHRIEGDVRLPRDGYRSRLTDFLNAFEHGFLALTDAELTPLAAGSGSERREFVAVAVRHIVLAAPVAGDSR